MRGLDFATYQLEQGKMCSLVLGLTAEREDPSSSL